MNATKKNILLLVSGLLLSTAVNAKGVLVAHPVTVGISELLLKDSGIEVIQALPKKLPASRQQNYLEKKGKAPLIELSKKADAVITVKYIYAKDYLYPLARRGNINIIPIDITQPIDGGKPGVAKLSSVGDADHLVWLNPNSLLAMMATFSDEIIRMNQDDPKAIEAIDKNLLEQQNNVREMMNSMEVFLDDLADEPIALVMNPKLSYFVQGLQLQYHTVNTKKITDEELLKIIKKQDINVVISSKKISKERIKMLSENGVASLKVNRIKSEDPIKQLAKMYANLRKAMKQ